MRPPMALRGHGLPRSRGMIFNMPPGPELSHRSTVPWSSHGRHSSRRWNGCRSSRASSLGPPQSDSRWKLSQDTTWQTVSWHSEPFLRPPSLDLEFEDWCLKILEYAEREDLEIAPSPEDTRDVHGGETSWRTDTASSLPHLHSLAWRQEQLPNRSLSLSGKGIKQQRRNATVFALPEDLRASSAEYLHSASNPPGASTGNFQLSPGYTSIPGTSGGHRQSSGSTGQRIAPHHHPETLQILEGQGPFVLDARDISRSQFRGRPGDSASTITLGSSNQLHSILRRNRIDGSIVEGQIHPWTSGVFNQHADEIVSSLRNMEDAAAAVPTEEQPSPKVTEGASAESGEEQASTDIIEGSAVASATEDQPSPEDIEVNIISLLESMATVGRNTHGQGREGRAPPGESGPGPDIESENSGDRSSPAGSPLPSLATVVPKRTGSKKERFRRFGRWCKRIVTR